MFLNFIKYILETKTSLEWSKYSFKIDFHILKVLKISLEIKIPKNDQIYHIRLTTCGRPHAINQKWESTI